MSEAEHVDEHPDDKEERIEKDLKAKKELFQQIKADISRLEKELEQAQRESLEAHNKRQQQAFSCAICHQCFSSEEPSVPVILDCETHAHTFCRLCLLTWSLEKGAKGEVASCPNCKARIKQPINKLRINHGLSSFSRKRRRELDQEEQKKIQDLMKAPKTSPAHVWDAVSILQSSEDIVSLGLALLKAVGPSASLKCVSLPEVLKFLRQFPDNHGLRDSGFALLNRIIPIPGNLETSGPALFAEMRKSKDILPRICSSLADPNLFQTLQQNSVGDELLAAIRQGSNPAFFEPDVLRLAGKFIVTDEDFEQLCLRIEEVSAAEETNKHSCYSLLKAFAGSDDDRTKKIFRNRIPTVVEFLRNESDAEPLEDAFKLLSTLGVERFTEQLVAHRDVVVRAMSMHKSCATINMAFCEWILPMVERGLIEDDYGAQWAHVWRYLERNKEFQKYKKRVERVGNILP